MKINDYPNLLIVTKLVEPIDISIKSVSEIKTHLRPDLEKIFIYGVFVLAVSRIEIMLSDILKYYLMCFPQKLSTEFGFDKDEFFKNYFTLLETTTDKYLYNLSYKSLEEHLNKFLKHLSIEWSDFQNSIGKDLQAIKSNRNSLLHTGKTVRVDDRKKQIDYDYVVQSTDKIISFKKELKERITEKYKDYTKINANKRLWQYLFKSPVMPYDDYWHYHKSKDHIFALKKGRYENNLSGSERMLLELWRSHFNGACINGFNMKSLDGATREKAMFFMSIAGDFSFE